jgi:glycine cleavage system protein P-like pyridoxal-binding family
MRYINHWKQDLSLNTSMISLGGAMKLNAASEKIKLEAWANIHPFAPHNQTKVTITSLKTK